jgi:UDP-galactopyranose mutase
MKIAIVGSGLSGITSAILLKEKGHDVEIFECRNHIGGNCYDRDVNGVKVHQYGAHIFHTNDEEVWSFLNRYTKFNNYVHKVRANTKLGLISIPYSKLTTQQIGRELSPNEITNLIFKQYSERHWGTSWDNLPKSITNRVPNKRDNFDDRYFTDKYQGIPENGYTEMLTAMLEGIKVHKDIFSREYKSLNHDLLVYTGKPDEYFDCCYGNLPYRSLRFQHTSEKSSSNYSFSKGAVINECNSNQFNRTVDNSVFLNQKTKNTILTKDFPEEHDESNEPIYPQNFGESLKLFERYKKLMLKENRTIFVGRLATYKYLDMWMAVKQAMVKIASL